MPKRIRHTWAHIPERSSRCSVTRIISCLKPGIILHKIFQLDSRCKDLHCTNQMWYVSEQAWEMHALNIFITLVICFSVLKVQAELDNIIYFCEGLSKSCKASPIIHKVFLWVVLWVRPLNYSLLTIFAIANFTSIPTWHADTPKIPQHQNKLLPFKDISCTFSSSELSCTGPHHECRSIQVAWCAPRPWSLRPYCYIVRSLVLWRVMASLVQVGDRLWVWQVSLCCALLFSLHTLNTNGYFHRSYWHFRLRPRHHTVAQKTVWMFSHFWQIIVFWNSGCKPSKDMSVCFGG